MSAGVWVVIKHASALRAAIADRRTEGSARVGFVPTMGYLHAGHASLVRRARAECDVVVVSIFVNPLQFGPGEDFGAYPRSLEQDLTLLAAERADIVFLPDASELYPRGHDTAVVVGGVTEPLEGASRPGHFRGVATVVSLLFNVVGPDVAYFGEKDWQQLQVVRKMVRDLRMPVEIVGVPTLRESDGLALSSRNVRLSPEERVAGVCVPRALAAARKAFASGEVLVPAIERVMHATIAREPLATLDYATVVDAQTLRPLERATASSRVMLAVKVGSVRLIDNGVLGH